MFSQEEIRDLQKILKNELSLEISDDEAYKHATQVINLLRITYGEAPDSSSNSPP